MHLVKFQAVTVFLRLGKGGNTVKCNPDSKLVHNTRTNGGRAPWRTSRTAPKIDNKNGPRSPFSNINQVPGAINLRIRRVKSVRTKIFPREGRKNQVDNLNREGKHGPTKQI